MKRRKQLGMPASEHETSAQKLLNSALENWNRQQASRQGPHACSNAIHYADVMVEALSAEHQAEDAGSFGRGHLIRDAAGALFSKASKALHKSVRSCEARGIKRGRTEGKHAPLSGAKRKRR